MQTAEQRDAKKSTLKAADALELARKADHIYAAKGKNVVHLDMKKDKPDDATLTGLIVGPTGNLRAPTLRVGKTLIVGFDATIYEQILT